MKLISKCETHFITNCIIKNQERLDGRQLLQGRSLEIVFGKERGCCMVLQGNTRVLVQVTCDISEAKASTPTEGIIHVNLELSAMAAPDAKTRTRTSEEFVESQRIIERCIRDSKCIDLESLCIITASKVWLIRVDIHTLNDDGNLIECASIAAISALAHFRRPEVTVVGTDVTVHSVEEKEPVALNLHHMPISINLALFNNGKYILVDPNDVEEKVCDGCYIIGMNAHQEMCFVHRRGVLLLKEPEIHRCEDVAIKRAQQITQIIRSALDDDAYKRATNAPIGFIDLIKTGTILGVKRQMTEITLASIPSLQENEPEAEAADIQDDIDLTKDADNEINMIPGASPIKSVAKERALRILEDSEALIFEGGASKWGGDTDEDAFEENAVEARKDSSILSQDKECVTEPRKDVSDIKEESDSEEEMVFVSEKHLDMKEPSSRGWFTKGFDL